MDPKLHRIITENALQQYLEFCPPETREILAKHSQLVVRGSDLEDWWPPLTRLRNWHFYPASPEIESGWVNRSSEQRFGVLAARLNGRKGERDQAAACRILGRILHHVQDMSCPAHVIPIYHASFLWYNRPDSFEEHFETYIGGLSTKLSRDEFDRCLTPDLAGFPAIYQQAAGQTLDYLRENAISATVDDKPTSLPLTFFYLPGDHNGPQCLQKKLRSRYPGFGNYGRLCNTFGQRSFTMSAYSYTVAAAEYQRIYHHLYHKAVADSIRAIACFAKSRPA